MTVFSLQKTGRAGSLYILFFISFLMFFPGCRRDNDARVFLRDGIVTLTYWPAPNPQEMELADSLVRVWNQNNPNIRVRMQAIPVGQSTEEVLLASIAANTTPDICSNIWPGALYDYTRAGGLVALDSFADFDSVMAERVSFELLESFRSGDGRFYQIPWKTNPVMMIYNVRMLHEMGYEAPPLTYSEYIEVGKRVREYFGDRVWMGQRDIRPIWWQRFFDFYPLYIAASGGRTLFADGDIDFVNEFSEQVFSFFNRVYAEGIYPRSFTHTRDPFLMEGTVTNFAGPWQIPTVQRYAPHIEMGVSTIPVPDDHVGPVYTYGDYKNISIFSSTDHPDEAWEFVKFLIEAENDLLLLEIANQIPARDDLLINPLFEDYFAENPNIVTFAEQAPYTRGVDAIPGLKEIFDAISHEYEASAVYGRKDPAKAVSDAARRTRVILDWLQ